ncbi:MAG: VWA domain-containing protein, partial [Blastocatellia bacterium]
MFKINRPTIFFALLTLAACWLSPAQSAQQPAQNPPTQAQQQNQDSVVRITTQLVQVDAVVVDKKGNHVEDLTADDFELFVDGKKQDLTHFKHNSLPPVKRELPPVKKSDAPPAPANMPTKQIELGEVRRTIAFIVDDLGLGFTSTERVRETLRQFLDRQMQPGDLVAIIRTGRGLGMLEQFTSDKRILYSAIEKLMWNPLSRDMTPSFGSESSLGESEESLEAASTQQSIDDGISSFRDTLFATGTLGAINFVVNGLRPLPGRKSVILLSDGFRIFPPSKNANDPDAVAQSEMVQQALKQLVEMANRSSVVIYSMDAKGLLPLVPGGETGGRPTGDSYAQATQDNQEALEGPVSLAAQTGGFATFNNNDLNIGIQEALYDQQSYYLVGFDPDDEKFDRKLHKIKVTVKRPGMRVRARQGFYGINDDESREVEKTRGQQIFGAMLSPLGVRDLSLKMTPYYFNSDKEGSLVRTLFHIESAKLNFKDTPDGKKAIKLDLAAFAFDDKGTAIDLSAKHVALTFDEAQYKQVMAEGLTYRADFPIKKPGAYQFRAVLRDAESGRLGTASEFINVPDLSKNRLAMSGLVLTIPKTEGEKEASADLRTTPYVRSFAKSGWIKYGSAIYNVVTDKKTGQPQLTVQAEIYRDGKLLKQLPSKAIELPAKASPKRFDFVG